jgi:hypothetical protein
MSYISVGDAARRFGPRIKPAQISQLFYERLLRDDLCPVVAGRRLIPLDYLPIIAAALRRKGVEVPEAALEAVDA